MSLRRTAARSLLWLIGVVGILLMAAFAIATSQDGSIKLLQEFVYWKRGEAANSFQPLTPPTSTVRGDGLRVSSNVRYGTRFPNSFMDIWYSPAARSGKRPTVIYMHGGGWFMGSKEWGDPLADAAGGERVSAAHPGTVASIASAGFNVVNLDYALAPAYRYPVPVIQLNDAIAFLRANAGNLGLDMTRVFIMGGSAGAQMTAQYGLLLSDPAYAADVGIRPSIGRGSVAGLLVFSAPLKVSGFGWRMNSILWSYLGTKDLDGSKQAKQVDILSHLNGNYPATYITDGNQPDTFPQHAKAMDRILTREGVDHVFNYYEPSVAKLDHGYTGRIDTPQGRDNLEKAIAFMKRHASDVSLDAKNTVPSTTPAMTK